MVATYDTDFVGHHTIRTTACKTFVGPSSSSLPSTRCDSCAAHRKVLNSMVSRQQKDRTEDRTQTDSHVNFRYLSTPDKYVIFFQCVQYNYRGTLYFWQDIAAAAHAG